MTTTFNIPVTILNEGCKLCPDLDLSHGIGYQEFTTVDGKIVSREFFCECDHLALCKRLRNKYIKKEDTANE